MQQRLLTKIELFKTKHPKKPKYKDFEPNPTGMYQATI